MDSTSSADGTGRRSVLCVPAIDARKIGRAVASGADEVVLDLEDAVAPGDKLAARQVVLDFPWHGHAALPLLSVRVNAPGTEWFEADVSALAGADLPVSSIVLPKVESRHDVVSAERLLDAAGSALTVQALVETAAGLVRLDRVVDEPGRLSALIIGYADLAASLGRRPGLGPEAWAYAQDRVLSCARAAGVDAVDGPFLGTAADEPFRLAACHAAALGFDAKWGIHPQQVPTLNEVFAPSAAEVDHARGVLAALGEGHASGRGAVSLDGQLVDEAMAVAARRVLGKARR